MTQPCIGSTQCISLSVVSGSLVATPVVNPAADNALTCGSSGLYVPGRSYVPLGTTFPAAPYNGQIVDYAADTTHGVLWSFRYNGLDPYPWEFLGGSALEAGQQSQTPVALTVPSTIDAPSAVISAPFQGWYDVEAWAMFGIGNGKSVGTLWARIGGELEPIIDESRGQFGTNAADISGVEAIGNAWVRTRRFVSTPGMTVQLRLNSYQNGTPAPTPAELYYYSHFVRITPVRVAP